MKKNKRSYRITTANDHNAVQKLVSCIWARHNEDIVQVWIVQVLPFDFELGNIRLCPMLFRTETNFQSFIQWIDKTKPKILLTIV